MKHSARTILFVFIIAGLSLCSSAQLRTSGISSADKIAIWQIFNATDLNSFRIQFDGEREIYGKKSITKTDLDQIKKTRIPAGEKAVIINWKGRMAIYFKDESLIYVSLIPGVTNQNEILYLLGAGKTAKLKTIMARYVSDPGVLENPTLIEDPDI